MGLITYKADNVYCARLFEGLNEIIHESEKIYMACYLVLSSFQC